MQTDAFDRLTRRASSGDIYSRSVLGEVRLKGRQTLQARRGRYALDFFFGFSAEIFRSACPSSSRGGSACRRCVSPPRRKTSRKRSAASSNAKRRESAVFYLDESIYSRILSEELQRAGMFVRRPGVDIPFGTPDAAWLATAGTEGWIVLMRDQRKRHRALEIQTLNAASVGAFVLTAGQAAKRRHAIPPRPCSEKIVNISRSEHKAFLYTLGIGGALSKLKIR